jgi:hypothetical protein
MQLFHYVAVRSAEIPLLARLDRDAITALFELLGALRPAVDDIDEEEDFMVAAPRLRPLGRGWREPEALLEAIELGSGETPGLEAVDTLLERIPREAHPFAFELVGYAGVDDEGTFRGGALVDLMVAALALDEAPPDLDRGRRSRWGALEYMVAAERFVRVPGDGRAAFEEGPRGDSALRESVVVGLASHGIAIPSTRRHDPAELDKTDPHCLLVWWWDLAPGVYLFEIPEAALDERARAILALAHGETFATATDVSNATWDALVEIMARLGGDHMPVGGRDRDAAGAWARFARGAVTEESGVIDQGGLNHRLREVVSVRRLA